MVMYRWDRPPRNPIRWAYTPFGYICQYAIHMPSNRKTKAKKIRTNRKKKNIEAWNSALFCYLTYLAASGAYYSPSLACLGC